MFRRDGLDYLNEIGHANEYSQIENDVISVPYKVFIHSSDSKNLPKIATILSRQNALSRILLIIPASSIIQFRITDSSWTVSTALHVGTLPGPDVRNIILCRAMVVLRK